MAASGCQLCFFSAVRLTGVAAGTVLAIASAPVFTGIVSRLTGGTPLTGRWLIATVAAIAGCAILVTGGKAAGAQLGGVGLALLAGFCYSVYLLYGRGLRTVPAPVAVTPGLAEPVVAALLDVVVLGERLTGPAVAGLVLAGLAIAVLTAGRTPADERVNTGLPG
ncbi:MAG TPA: EamA family transporter [Streptosporangiaceae bacterium]